MTRQQYSNQYDNEYEENIPMPRSGNYNPNQDQRNRGNGGNQPNQKHNKGNQQQDQRNRDAPNFKPPQPVRAQEKDQLYQLVVQTNIPNKPGETFWVDTLVFYAQGRGMVDGSFGLSMSQVIGYAYVSGGNTFYTRKDEPEYAFLRERIDDYWKFIFDADFVLNNPGRVPKPRNVKPTVVQYMMPIWLRWTLFFMFLAALAMVFFMTRGG